MEGMRRYQNLGKHAHLLCFIAALDSTSVAGTRVSPRNLNATAYSTKMDLASQTKHTRGVATAIKGRARRKSELKAYMSSVGFANRLVKMSGEWMYFRTCFYTSLVAGQSVGGMKTKSSNKFA